MLQRAQLSVGPAAARVRERPVRMLQAHTRMRAVRCRACPNYVPAERRAGLRARRNLRWPSARSCERAATPVLLTAFAWLSRCRQPQLRALGLDGQRALDISATTGRHTIDSSVTMILR
jgi:hypothetical protein